MIYAFTDPSNVDQLKYLATMDTIFNAIYIGDFLIRLIGYGVENFFNDTWCKFDFIMVMVKVISMIGIEYLYFLKKAKSGKLLKLSRVEKVIRIFRTIRGIKLLTFLKYGADTVRRIKILFQKVSICFPIA